MAEHCIRRYGNVAAANRDNLNLFRTLSNDRLARLKSATAASGTLTAMRVIDRLARACPQRANLVSSSIVAGVASLACTVPGVRDATRNQFSMPERTS
jgi:hypothetical protein